MMSAHNPIKKKTTMKLPCPLTQKEFEERAKALASTENELHEEEQRQQSVKAGLKAQVSDITKRRTMLAEIVSTSTEFREVECEETFDFSTAKVTRVRLDTGEVIVTRPMTDEERQRGLFGEI